MSAGHMSISPVSALIAKSRSVRGPAGQGTQCPASFSSTGCQPTLGTPAWGQCPACKPSQPQQTLTYTDFLLHAKVVWCGTCCTAQLAAERNVKPSQAKSDGYQQNNAHGYTCQRGCSVLHKPAALQRSESCSKTINKQQVCGCSRLKLTKADNLSRPGAHLQTTSHVHALALVLATSWKNTSFSKRRWSTVVKRGAKPKDGSWYRHHCYSTRGTQ